MDGLSETPAERRVEGASILVAGVATGSLLFSKEPLSFWGGYDSESGELIDRRHPLSGQIAACRVLALPATRGSSTTTAVLVEAIRQGTGPAALVTRGPDTFLALACIVAREMYGSNPPVVSLEPDEFDRLEGAAEVRIDEDGVFVRG